MNLDYKKIGKFIAELRKERKMTQEKLAGLLYVDRTTISKWELGQNNINTDTLIKIADIFNLTINEIIIGEKKTDDNIKEINGVTVNIIKNNIKFKKYLIISIIFILTLISSFFTYYFINNYNSIMVYEIHGETNDFAIHNGLMVVSREKTYIQIGNIKSLNNKKVSLLNLYYKINNRKIILSLVDDTNSFFVITYDDDQFKYSDLKYVISNLYLEVTDEDGEVSNTKLVLKKTYSNKNIFYKNNKNINQSEINDLNHDIPNFVKDNFTLDEKDKCYYMNKYSKNVNVDYYYFYEVDVYSIEEFYNNYSIRFTFSNPDITYSRINNEGNILEEFVYSYDNDKCLQGNCDKKILEYFESNYLKEIKK